MRNPDPKPRQAGNSAGPPETGSAPVRGPSAPSEGRTEPQTGSLTGGRDNRPAGEEPRLGKYGLLVLMAAVGVAVFQMVRIFIVPAVLAATFAALFYPMYCRFLGLLRGNRPAASLICCILLVICLLVPIYVVSYFAFHQFVNLYTKVEPFLRSLGSGETDFAAYQRIAQQPLVRWILSLPVDWQTLLSQSAERIGSIVAFVVNRTSSGVLAMLFQLIIMLFTLFYFFMDGARLVRYLRYLSPLRDEYEELIIARFLLMARATLKGSVVVALTQGTLGALILLVLGIESWLFLGFIMIVLAMIPMMGAWMVLIPMGIIQILNGRTWPGVLIIILGVCVVSMIDNIIRPRLVGRGARMHALVIFFSTLGGISVFGVMGFIVGPVLGSLFISLVESYGTEFKGELRRLDAPKT